MSASRTKFPKSIVPARKIHQSTAIIGKNGLPVDALATIEPGSTLIEKNATGVTYSGPTVTVDSSIDLSVIENISPQSFKHTGVLLFTDASRNDYFIDMNSINNTTKTFDIYTDPKLTIVPTTIDLLSGWYISEAELVNRLQTTSSPVIDSVEFRDVEVKLDLNAKTDSVSIKDSQGDELNVNPDGSINVVATGATVATNPFVANVAMPTKNTEYNFIFPTGTKKIKIKLRNDGKLKYSFSLGGSGSNFVTVHPGSEEILENFKLNSPLTLYFQSSKAGETLEILYWI